MLLTLPETARGVVGNGILEPPPLSRLPHTACVRPRESLEPMHCPRPKRQRSFPNPLTSLGLLLGKDNAVVVFAGAFLYMTFCCLPASLGTLFIEIYHLNELQAGLIYLPFGLGCTLAALASGKLIDRDYRKTAESHNLPIDRIRGDDLRTFPIEHEPYIQPTEIRAEYAPHGGIAIAPPHLWTSLYCDIYVGPERAERAAESLS